MPTLIFWDSVSTRVAERKLRSQLGVDQTLNCFIDEWPTIDELCSEADQLMKKSTMKHCATFQLMPTQTLNKTQYHHLCHHLQKLLQHLKSTSRVVIAIT